MTERKTGAPECTYSDMLGWRIQFGADPRDHAKIRRSEPLTVGLCDSWRWDGYAVQDVTNTIGGKLCYICT